MRRKFILTSMAALACLMTHVDAAANLVINEIMQSNIDCIMDDLNEFPDSWVELYNPGETVQHLEEYYLGDSDKPSKAYRLPALDISPKEFIVIYCDKGNQNLHTDFRLESGKGGGVYLYHEGDIVSKIENWKKQPAPNIAYGKENETSDKWGYQSVPTPGLPNCGELRKDILPEPIFSREGMVFTNAFSLELGIPQDAPEGTSIHYTMDGTEPSEMSPIYDSPLTVESCSIIRAKLFCDGYLSPRSTTHSYIIHPRDLTLPVISIVSDDSYFYDDKTGIMVEGSYNEGIPNYEYDWRRPINIEYFEDINSKSLFNQLCETRIKGGGSRKLPLKSMVVYANKRFGSKRFYHEFFPTQTPGITEFKSFELRNSGDDFNTTYMRDAIIQKSMGMNCDLDWQPSQPCIVYVNGIYKGILNIRPRSNEDYVYSYYEGLEDLDMIENWHELKEGSKDNFESFKKFYNQEGHTYSEFESIMDTEEFCNLMIMNIFFDNKDFPANNIVMWRPTAEDGKWRWVAKDTDFGIGLYGEPYDYNTLEWITTPGYDNDHNSWANREAYTLLFRRLLQTEEFRNMFIDRCAVYLGDFLTVDEITRLINERYEELAFEYDFHRKNMGDHNSMFEKNVQTAKEWVTNRVPIFYDQLASFFSLEKPIPLSISTDGNKPLSFAVNGISLNNTDFNGKYFPGRNLSLSTSNDLEDNKTIQWMVTYIDGGKQYSQQYVTPELNITMLHGSKVNIVAKVIEGEGNAIESISQDPLTMDWYDTAGKHVATQHNDSKPELPAGIYIVRQGSNVRKVSIK